jgi:hypothetical protein
VGPGGGRGRQRRRQRRRRRGQRLVAARDRRRQQRQQPGRQPRARPAGRSQPAAWLAVPCLKALACAACTFPASACWRAIPHGWHVNRRQLSVCLLTQPPAARPARARAAAARRDTPSFTRRPQRLAATPWARPSPQPLLLGGARGPQILGIPRVIECHRSARMRRPLPPWYHPTLVPRLQCCTRPPSPGRRKRGQRQPPSQLSRMHRLTFWPTNPLHPCRIFITGRGVGATVAGARHTSVGKLRQPETWPAAEPICRKAKNNSRFFYQSFKTGASPS